METVSFAEFERLDLRVGEVLEVFEVEGLDRVLKLSVDLGELGTRTILAGLKESHDQDELVGKQVMVVANLAPKKIGGEISEGMILAADTEQGPVLLVPNKEVDPGKRVV